MYPHTRQQEPGSTFLYVNYDFSEYLLEIHLALSQRISIFYFIAEIYAENYQNLGIYSVIANGGFLQPYEIKN